MHPIDGRRTTRLLALLAFLWSGSLPAQEIRDVTRTDLSIGAVDGAPHELLHRVSAPFVLPDGRLVIPDGGTAELRVHGSDGRWLASWGTEGDGPGEYRDLTGAWPYPGDSLAVFDARLQRVTILSAAPGEDGGRVGRTFRTGRGAGGGVTEGGPSGAEGAREFVAGVFDDGTFLARRGEMSVGPGDTTRVARDTFPWFRLGPDGQETRFLVRLPDTEIFVWAEGGSRLIRALPFPRVTSVAVHGDRWYAAHRGDAFVVDVRDGAGRVVRQFGSGRAGPELPDEVAEAWRSERVEEVRDGFLAENAIAALRAMPMPDRLPAHGRLVAGRDGRVWLEEGTLPDEGPVWTVFDADGRAVDRVRFPVGFRLTWADGSHALGVTVDDLGVERVVRMPLR